VKRREDDGIYDDHERRHPGTPPMITALEVGVGFLLPAALVTAVAVLSARRLGVMASRDEEQREVEGGSRGRDPAPKRPPAARCPVLASVVERIANDGRCD
jgi:hypothetical protein